MGSDVTDTSSKLSAFLVPFPFSETVSDDYRIGTDYAEIDREVGPFAQDSPSPVGISATGSPPSALTSLAFRCSRSGAPRDAQWRWSSDGGSTFYAHQPIQQLSSHLGNSGYNGTDDQHAQGLEGGGFIHLQVNPSTGAYTYRVEDETRTVTSNSTFGPSTADLTTGSCCVFPDPTDGDGSKWLAMVAGGSDSDLRVDLYRSTDTGATWSLASRDVLPSIQAQLVRLRAYAVGGQVLCMVSTVSGGTTTTRQLLSVNGGASFAQIVSATNQAVGDINAIGGYFLVLLHTNVDSGTETLKLIRIGDASTSFLSDAGLDVSTALVSEVCSCLSPGPGGRMFLSYITGTTERVQLAYTDDAGATVSNVAQVTGSGTQGMGTHALTMWRERPIVMGCEYNGTTLTSTGHEFMVGGYGGIADGFGEWTDVWIPVEGIVAPAYTITSVTPTLSRTADHYSVVLGGGDAWQAQAAKSGMNGPGGAHLWYVLTPGGDSKITLENGDATDQASVDVDITTTGIRAYGTGTSAPSYTSHGISGKVEFYLAFNVAADEGTLYYREFNNAGTEKDWSAVAVSNSITGSFYNGLRITIDQTSSGTVLHHAFAYAATGTRTTQLAESTTPDVGLMPGIALPPVQGPMVAGVRAVSEGGLEYASDNDHTASTTSPYRKANTLPRVSPSPSRGWRTDTAAATSLRYHLNEGEADAIYLEGDSLAVYLSGLRGVHAVNIKDNTTSLTGGSVSLGYAVDIERSGSDSRTVRPATTGADDDGRWVEADELKGWTCVFASGDARQITSNTEGTLGHGATVDTKRATWRITGVDGSESTSGTATLYPPEALIVIPFRGTSTYEQIRIDIGAGEMDPTAYGYVQVGTVAIGALTYMGRNPDKTEVITTTANTEASTREDGTQRVRTLGAARRRLTLSFVDDVIDVTQVSGDDTSPDYITSSASGSAAPAATRFGVTRALRGIYRQAGGDEVPIVYCDGLDRDPGTGATYQLYTFQRAHALYGRIQGDVREERVPRVGQRWSSELVRMPTITLLEEV